MDNRRFVALDLETGGLDPDVHPIIEVGLVIEHAGTNQTTEEHFSLPFSEEICSEEALEINQWGKRPFPREVDPHWAAGFLASVLNDSHIVGKNPHFDEAFLKKFFESVNIKPTWHHRLVDVGSLSWGFYNGQRMMAYELEPVRRNLGEYEPWPQPPNAVKAGDLVGRPMLPTEHHTALGDARWAYDVFRACVPRLHLG